MYTRESYFFGWLAIKFRYFIEWCATIFFSTQVAYQKILQLSYIDKFLTDIQMEFRNKYKDCLTDGTAFGNFNFMADFNQILKANEEESKAVAKSQK